jgi:hypothetical protein
MPELPNDLSRQKISPALIKKNAWSLLHYYKLGRSRLKNPRIDYDSTICAWQLQYPHLPSGFPTLADIILGSRKARDDLRQAQQHAAELREAYLLEKARMYDDLEQMGNARAVQRLKQAEDLSRTYSKIQRARTPEGSTGLTEIQVPIDSTIHPKECPPDQNHWRTERVPTEIENLLIDRNRSHFGQAEGTPLTVPTIKAALHYDGSGPMAELILDGQYNDDSLDEATQLFLQHLKRRTGTVLSGTITTQDFIGKLKTWDERTSTSPSGWHLGHYHVLWRKHKLKDTHKDYQCVEKGQALII